MFGYCKAKLFSQLGGLCVKLLVYSKCWAVVNKTDLIWPLRRDLLQEDSTVVQELGLTTWFQSLMVKWRQRRTFRYPETVELCLMQIRSRCRRRRVFRIREPWRASRSVVGIHDSTADSHFVGPVDAVRGRLVRRTWHTPSRRVGGTILTFWIKKRH